MSASDKNASNTNRSTNKPVNKDGYVQLLVEDSDESDDEGQKMFSKNNNKLDYDLNLDYQELLNGAENQNLGEQTMSSLSESTDYAKHITKSELVIIDDYQDYNEQTVAHKDMYRDGTYNLLEYENNFMIGGSLNKVTLNHDMEINENKYMSILRDHDYYTSQKDESIRDMKNFIITNAETSDNPLEVAVKFTKFVLDKYDIGAENLNTSDEITNSLREIDEHSKLIKDRLNTSTSTNVIDLDSSLSQGSITTIEMEDNSLNTSAIECDSRIGKLNKFVDVLNIKARELNRVCSTSDRDDNIINKFIAEIKYDFENLFNDDQSNKVNQMVQTEITKIKMDSLMNTKYKNSLLNSISSEDSSDESDADEDTDKDLKKLNCSSDELRLFVSDDEISQSSNPSKKSTTKEITNSLDCSVLDANDAKIKMQPKIILTKISGEDIEKYNDELRDKEIDKLVNFSTLDAARYSSDPTDRIVNKPNKKTKQISNVLDDILKDSNIINTSDESGDEDHSMITTEHQFLIKANEKMKQSLLQNLETSSSVSEDSYMSTNILDSDMKSAEEDSASNDSIMSQYLNDIMMENEDQSLEKDSLAEKTDDDISNESNARASPETDLPDISKFLENNLIESDKELQINDIGNNINNNDNKSTFSELKAPTITKTTPARHLDSVDSQIFSKQLENKVTDNKINDNRENDDSDVELVDLGMFHNNKDINISSGDAIDSSDVTSKANDDFDLAKLFKKTDAKTKKSNTTDYISLSSDSDSDTDKASGTNEAEDNDAKKRGIRAMLSNDQLAEETIRAQKEEQDRIKRVKEKKIQIISKCKESQTNGTEFENELILDYDSKKKINISIHPDIVKLLKPHQIDGVKFMYESCYGSVDFIKYPASGCILAHCMGLGKTLQLITLLHTLIRYPQLRTRRVLVLCPKSTVINWAEEFQRWLGPIKHGPKLKVFYFPDNSDVSDKLKILKEWFNSTATKAGCLLIGYEAFRALVGLHKRKNNISLNIEAITREIEEYVLDPGADLVICDEGHVIKNRKSATNCAVTKIKTRRRIILTGTPIQNNLNEYYCMVNFIKPSFLGTEKEFANLYANPIKNGQHKDSDSRAIKVMKQRSYVLHNKLSKFVQRKEAAVLKEFLPEKYEYVIFTPLTEVQERLYNLFLQNNAMRDNQTGKSLIPDYTLLRKIWTHPKVLENAWENALNKENKQQMKRRSVMNVDDDDVPDDVLDSQVGNMSVTTNWWRNHIDQNDFESIIPSNKIQVMFEILKLCKERGEKCLIFSAFVAVLNIVEHFMMKIHNQNMEANSDQYGFSQFKGPWVMGQDYYRLDGKTSKSIRHTMISKFNDPQNKRVKCFLISAKAGGQGINLIGANRVIILDTSWNPSNDQQNIFRVFRLGQKRKCFVYRLIAMGSMEEKVYSRSVTKQAMSFRVVDEQQIDRHYSMAELSELYTLTNTDFSTRPTPMLPADDILAHLLKNFPRQVYKYHEHDSLLENKLEQELSEQDKKEAWDAYELAEKSSIHNQQPAMFDAFGFDMGMGLKYSQTAMPFGYGDTRSYLNSFGMPSSLYNNNYINNPYAGLDPSLIMMNNLYNRYNSNPGSQPSSSAANSASNYTNFPSPNTNSNYTNPSFLNQLPGSSLMNMFSPSSLTNNYLKPNSISNTLNSLSSMTSSILPDAPMPAHQSSLTRSLSNSLDNSNQYFELLQLKNYMSGGSMLSLNNSSTLHTQQQQQAQQSQQSISNTLPPTSLPLLAPFSTASTTTTTSSVVSTNNHTHTSNMNTLSTAESSSGNIQNSMNESRNNHISSYNNSSSNHGILPNYRAKVRERKKSIPNATATNVISNNNNNLNPNITSLPNTSQLNTKNNNNARNTSSVTISSVSSTSISNNRHTSAMQNKPSSAKGDVEHLSNKNESDVQFVSVTHLNKPSSSSSPIKNPILSSTLRKDQNDLKTIPTVVAQNKPQKVTVSVQNNVSVATLQPKLGVPNTSNTLQDVGAKIGNQLQTVASVVSNMNIKRTKSQKSINVKAQNQNYPPLPTNSQSGSALDITTLKTTNQKSNNLSPTTVANSQSNKKISISTVNALTKSIQSKQSSTATSDIVVDSGPLKQNPYIDFKGLSQRVTIKPIDTSQKQVPRIVTISQATTQQTSNVVSVQQSKYQLPIKPALSDVQRKIIVTNADVPQTTANTSKQVIRNNNMGIVYPPAANIKANVSTPTIISNSGVNRLNMGSKLHTRLITGNVVNPKVSLPATIPISIKTITSSANNVTQINTTTPASAATTAYKIKNTTKTPVPVSNLGSGVTQTTSSPISVSAIPYSVTGTTAKIVQKDVIRKDLINNNDAKLSRAKLIIKPTPTALAAPPQQNSVIINNLMNNTSQLTVVKTLNKITNAGNTVNNVQLQQKLTNSALTSTAVNSRKRNASDIINDLITSNKTLTVSTVTSAPPAKKPNIVPPIVTAAGVRVNQINTQKQFQKVPTVLVQNIKNSQGKNNVAVSVSSTQPKQTQKKIILSTKDISKITEIVEIE